MTQDKASSTPRPTFKTTPLYYKMQILPDLREQVLLELLMHWLKEQATCQDTVINIWTSEHYTFWVEDIDKIGERHA